MAAVVQFPDLSKCLKKGRQADLAYRPSGRKHLTPDEVERMIDAARRRGRNRVRDALLIMLAYRHGLRASELIALRWDHLDLKAGTLIVNRLKSGSPSTHELRGPETRLLHAWRKEQGSAPYVFTSERGGPMHRITVHHVVSEAGKAAGIEFPVHPHMLRHACGFYLANRGVDTRGIQSYLGHKNIQNTVGYTAMSATRHKDYWKD